MFFPSRVSQYIPHFYGLKHDNRKPGEIFTQPGCQENYTATSPGFSDGPFDADLEVVFNLFNFTPKKKIFPAAFFQKNVGSNKAFLSKKSGAESFRATLDYILISPQLEVRRLESVDQLVPLLVHAVSQR